MAYNTGYPSTANVVNHQAFKLGCDLLDLQDRLLTRDGNKKVRATLGLDQRIQFLTLLSFDLDDVVEGRVQCPAQVAVTLNKVKNWNLRLGILATRLKV